MYILFVIADEGLFTPVQISKSVLPRVAQEGNGRCLKRNKMHLERNIMISLRKTSSFQVSHLSFLLQYYFAIVLIIKVEHEFLNFVNAAVTILIDLVNLLVGT